MTQLRSWMFVPGNNQRRLEKVKNLTSDVIIYDLEDSVPLQEKGNAREMVVQAIESNKDCVQYVRINDSSTPFFHEDLQTVIKAGAHGIVLPKANRKEQVLELATSISLLERQSGISAETIDVVPIIESADGLYHAYEIATVNRVSRLAFGSVDFLLDLGAKYSHEGTEILFARSQLTVISRAANKEQPIDAVFVDINDAEGLKRDALLARQLGFQGKLVIHPGQIEIVNEAFSPTPDELAEAREIVEAFERAIASGSASIQVNGKLVDYPVAVRAKRILGGK